MANFHCTAQMISRQGGKSCVPALAYRSATKLEDQGTGEIWDYTNKPYVGHVELLIPHDAPAWIADIARECRSDRRLALQKFSDIIEASEKRKDSQVYREVEFSLPNELTKEQNIEWANAFVRGVFVERGMVAIVNFHFDIDPKTGMEKPHCHALLSTRHLTGDGFGLKNRDWNSAELIDEAREQCAQYQNTALKQHGHDVQVTHLSYVDRNVEIDPQPKLGASVREMSDRGTETDKQKIFDMVRLKNQFKIVKNPEIVFAIVTSKHSTFTRKDVAKILNRYIDDAGQFQTLLDRLMNSKELVDLESSSVHREIPEPVYTTRAMLRVELNLIKAAEKLSTQKTHNVQEKIVEGAIDRHNEKLAKYGGLSLDQQAAIRQMLSSDQISCVVGFAGAGKTTCLDAAREAWEESGYKIVGLAPTGKAARNMEGCSISSMTIHKFLLTQEQGRERVSARTILVLDEGGMVDSRRFGELLALVNQTGAKIVVMGDGNQLQSIEAGPAFRLLLDRIKPAVLETIVRQQIEWQREATCLFGTLETRKALESYQANGCFTTVQEKTPDWMDQDKLLDHFCLARQMSGRIWKEMQGDFTKEFGKDVVFNPETDFETLAKHQDFPLFQNWKKTRQAMVGRIIDHYGNQEEKLKERGVDVKTLGSLVAEYKVNLIPNLTIFKKIETMLRQMSYEHIVDTRENAREAMVKAWGEDWAKDREVMPDCSHIMLTFTNKDANKLNEAAREFMRAEGVITGVDHTLETQRIDEDDFGKQIITFQDRTFANGDRLLFTRNDNSLNVKNGSLGTILEISKQKITVALDDTQKTLSFAPNLYPFIDNGWATTIHKAQGVTADVVKLLASFEQYRNLAYVGMSRHRHSVKLYASSLDFWREEKIIDRLSRIQEKLSGFDYLDADKIQEALKEDTAILWHEQKINQARDFWTAIKVTARDVFDKVLVRPQEDKGTEEEFLSFEDSEEMRSKDFFETSTDTKSKGAFAEGDSSLEGSPSEGTGTDRTANKDQSRASAPRSQKPSQEERDRVVEQKPKAQESMTQGSGTNEPFIESSGEQEEGKKVHQEEQPSLSNDEFKKKLEAVKEKIKSDYDTRIVTKEKHLSFEEVDKQLKERIYELATSIFGEPNRGSRNSAYLRFGGADKFSVGVRGKHHGIYTNFVTGVKGGPLKLIEDQMGYSSFKEALGWAREWLGGHCNTVEHQVVRKAGKEQQEAPKLEWKPIVPVPNGVKGPDLTNKYLNYMLKDGWHETGRYAYRDAQGSLKGYVVRVERERGDGKKNDKKPMPLAWCENKELDITCWKSQAFDKENKTPYGIEKLAQDISKPILVVEGEKTADVAQKRLPGYHVLSWIGGAGNVGLTNWEPLVGRTVIIWPDNDEAGRKAAWDFQKVIGQLGDEKDVQAKVGIVRLPKNLSEGWDLGDSLPNGWTDDTVVQMIQEAMPVREEISAQEKSPPPDESTSARYVGSKSKTRAETDASPPSRVIPISSSSDASLGRGSSEASPPEASPPETSSPVRSPKKPSPLIRKQEQFEQDRLPFHQEWCAQLGFFMQHRRFPNKGKEIAAAWWQGERLTAIEGRLYREALERKEEPDEKQLTLDARAELTKNQKAPNYIMTLGKASYLDKTQLKQFEQHVLIHQDKTGQLPNSSDLDALCQAIKVRGQIMEVEGVNNRANNQAAAITKMLEPTSVEQASEKTPDSDIYRNLIEQQVVLARIKGDGLKNLVKSENKTEEMSAELQTRDALQAHDIKDSCSEKLERLGAKIQSVKEFSQGMKALGRSRQNQRGIEM
jgi:Ti-type conjugative transfer relaxase TraA